jgi:hypothetical protein
MNNEITSARRLLTVTPSDSTVLPEDVRCLYVGTGGDVAVVDAFGNDVTFSSVPSGMLLPVQVVKVKSTGTTASNIVAMG